ncbi:hypothetical protein K474DRAFT_1754690 [Panus rudis PR-1116 ss-1]|nr:hypothetical protein K474DRAFT_1754690 [Panus rudis PR-1116 ss-1]
MSAAQGQLTTLQRETNRDNIQLAIVYALDELPKLADLWFRHNDSQYSLVLKRDGNSFECDFRKSNFSSWNPSLLGYSIHIPQIVSPSGTVKQERFSIWITHPQADANVNRRAVLEGLRLLASDPTRSSAQIDAACIHTWTVIPGCPSNDLSLIPKSLKAQSAGRERRYMSRSAAFLGELDKEQRSEDEAIEGEPNIETAYLPSVRRRPEQCSMIRSHNPNMCMMIAAGESFAWRPSLLHRPSQRRQLFSVVNGGVDLWRRATGETEAWSLVREWSLCEAVMSRLDASSRAEAMFCAYLSCGQFRLLLRGGSSLNRLPLLLSTGTPQISPRSSTRDPGISLSSPSSTSTQCKVNFKLWAIQKQPPLRLFFSSLMLDASPEPPSPPSLEDFCSSYNATALNNITPTNRCLFPAMTRGLKVYQGNTKRKDLGYLSEAPDVRRTYELNRKDRAREVYDPGAETRGRYTDAKWTSGIATSVACALFVKTVLGCPSKYQWKRAAAQERTMWLLSTRRTRPAHVTSPRQPTQQPLRSQQHPAQAQPRQSTPSLPPRVHAPRAMAGVRHPRTKVGLWRTHFRRRQGGLSEWKAVVDVNFVVEQLVFAIEVIRVALEVAAQGGR